MRNARDDGEDLDRHVAVNEPRQVDMSIFGSLEEVPIPDQAVGMQVDGQHRLVVSEVVGRELRLIRAAIGLIGSLFNEGRRQAERAEQRQRDRAKNETSQNPPHRTFHLHLRRARYEDHRLVRCNRYLLSGARQAKSLLRTHG